LSRPTYRIEYSSTEGSVTLAGHCIDDADAFRLYLSGPVRERLRDTSPTEVFESDLRVLATTDMASDALSQWLAATVDPSPWEVGEALAECLLADVSGILWPWNSERDKRTPRASLPGADLVGFVRTAGTVYLVLGEVKTSSDRDAPPNVLSGRSGMIHQLDQLAQDLRVNREACSAGCTHVARELSHGRCTRKP